MEVTDEFRKVNYSLDKVNFGYPDGWMWGLPQAPKNNSLGDWSKQLFYVCFRGRDRL